MSLKNEALAAHDAAGVYAGQQWQRTGGKRYSIVATGVSSEDYTPVVVFADAAGVVWTLPLKMFLVSFMQSPSLVELRLKDDGGDDGDVDHASTEVAS
jgi:hypothetical protein